MFSDNRSTCALLCVAGLLICESCLGHYQGFEISVSVQNGWKMRGVDDRAAGTTEVTDCSIRFMDFQRDRKADLQRDESPLLERERSDG